jgi:hypothetical protein
VNDFACKLIVALLNILRSVKVTTPQQQQRGSSFAVGRRVTLKDLQSSATLNGRNGTILGVCKEKPGRYIVVLDMINADFEQRVLQVKLENLRSLQKNVKSTVGAEMCDGCLSMTKSSTLRTCGRCQHAVFLLCRVPAKDAA